MKIPETQTSDDFPDGAIKQWDDKDNSHVLVKVTDRTGTAILWERDGSEEVPAEPEEPSRFSCDLCPKVCGNAGALVLHKRAAHPAVAATVTKSYQPPVDHGQALPEGVTATETSKTYVCARCEADATHSHHTVQTYEGEPLRTAIAIVDAPLCGACHDWLSALLGEPS